jgi:gliding motility-associated-like protein
MRVFAQAPVINSFTPASGPVGTVVTIMGSGFSPAAANNVVFFGATIGTVTAASTTTLTVTVPSGATYSPIAILNGNSALIGYSPELFIPTFTPSKGAITHDDFMAPVGFDTGAAGGVFISDIDGDGKPDLVIGIIKNNSVSILRNISSSGTISTNSFAPKIDFPVAAGFGFSTFAIGDIDGDGKTDLVLSSQANSDSEISVFRNTSTIGSISFAPKVDFTALTAARGIAIGDLDGDGKSDIAIANGQSGGISLWRNISTPGSISTSSFEARVDLLINDSLHSFGTDGIAIGDLDGDKKPDIVIGNDLNGTISVLMNTSTAGSFNALSSFALPVNFPTGGRADDVTIADLDGDGKPDLAVVNTSQPNGSPSISILRNTSTPGSMSANSFMPAVIFNVGPGPDHLALGDLDGDGKPDIVVANPFTNSGSIVVLRNTATSGSIKTTSFASQLIFPTNKFTASVAIGDLDGDGEPDIITPFDSGQPTGTGMYIYRNNPLFPPKTQATNLVFTNTATNTTTVSWTNGNGPSRAVFISNTTTGSPIPVQSTTYTANPAFRSGSQIGSSGWYCIYNGTGNTVDVTGLSSGATYRVMVVEYNGTAGAENYLTTTAAGNPANVTTVAGGSIAINSINRVTAQLTNAGSVQYAATFATPVTGLTAANFGLVTTGGISGTSIISVTGSGSNYMITVNTGTGDGTVGLNLANATGLTPGIITPLPFTGQTYTLDRTAPAITISNPSDSTILSTRGPVTYKVSYSDLNFNNSTLTASDLTLNHSGSAAGTVSVSGSDNSYTVTVSNITGSGSLGISIASGTATDSAGNLASAAGPSKTFLIAPVLSGLTASSGTLSPVFADTTMSYTAVVNNAISTITIIPALTDPNATVTVNGGNPSAPVNLVLGLNTIPVTVTMLDGKSSTIYTVGIVRAAPVATGKAPDISYNNGNIAITSNQPFSVTPTNKGGAVPQTHYGQVTLFAGSRTETPGYINDTGTAALFNNAQQAAMDGAGNLYVTDAYNNAIRMITPSGVVSTFAGSATGLIGFTDGTGTAANFNFPDGTAIDQAGNLYVSDYNNNSIRKISPLRVVTTIYHPANLFGPGGMRIDASGNIIVTAQDASQIIKITPAGVATVLAGSTMGYANGTSLTAQFNTPGDVEPDTLGNLYVADFNNSAIRKINPAGLVTTVAGSDAPTVTPGFADGLGTASLFNYPAGLCVAPGGVVYVADLYNNDVRRIMPDGTVNLIAGSATQAPGDTDGIGTAAKFNLPVYIYVDGSGTGYVSEIGGNRIRKLILTGYTLKGTLPAGLAFDPTTGIISGTPTIPFTATTDTVTAFNAFGYSTTIFHINYQPPSTIATLVNLVPGSGSLVPAFSSATTIYTVNLPNSTASLALTPTATDSTATIKVNGVPVTSGTASGSTQLAVGPNSITITVTAQDSVTKDIYTVIVNRAALSTVATLNDLTISSGILSPAFTAGGINYSATVANNVSSITVTPTASDVNATIRVNDVPVLSGTASTAIQLTVGPNTITTVVTAQNGTTTNTYTVFVTRAPSSDASLTNLIVSKGTLTPAFSSSTFTYADNVPNAATGITVTPTNSDNTATITVNGATVASGTASGLIPLAVGRNTISIVVIAQDGTATDIYTVVVTRAASADAALVNLTVSEGTLAPAFSNGTAAYSDTVSNLITSLTVTATISNQNATVKVNGTAVANGSASGTIPLMAGANTITVIITAQDGTTTNTYTITVYRGESMGSIDATNVLTPNGDGKNDYWLIKDIGLYPENKVTVYDKAGRVVYAKRGYSNEWDGTLNGSPLAEGTYYFVVDLGPDLRKFKGYVSILRN